MPWSAVPLRVSRHLLPLVLLVLLSACAAFQLPSEQAGADLPPVLAQDEILRPYTVVGTIHITTEHYLPAGNPYEWGMTTLRNEAARMAADAVMLPEIVSRPVTTGQAFDASKWSARGVAIKFK